MVTPVTPDSDAYQTAMCGAADVDYPGDTWDACISDDGPYVLAGESTPSSAARVAAFEDIAALLWRSQTVTLENLVDAELIYGEDGGVGSRVTRRYDSHISKPEGADCKADNAGTQWPEYCVGPAQIEPLILNAFADAIAGNDLDLNMAKIRAGLLWFYYVSAYKEAYTCAGKAADCDSHWAYTNGAKQRDEDPLGLGALILQQSAEAYDALFDAHLGIRCWRDLDAAEVADNDMLHQKALAQLDRALDYGYSLVLIAELQRWTAGGNRVKAFAQQTVEILGPPMARAANDRQATHQFDQVSTWQNLTDDKAQQLIEQLQSIFPCP